MLTEVQTQRGPIENSNEISLIGVSNACASPAEFARATSERRATVGNNNNNNNTLFSEFIEVGIIGNNNCNKFIGGGARPKKKGYADNIEHRFRTYFKYQSLINCQGRI